MYKKNPFNLSNKGRGLLPGTGLRQWSSGQIRICDQS